MIVGAGTDLCDIRRIAQVLERHGDRFLQRVFTEAERAHAERRNGEARIATYAKRWAAKEACAKALGTGFAQGVAHSMLGVVNRRGGAPTMVLTGGAAARLAALVPQGWVSAVHVSLTDEPPYALAHVMIEALPPVV
ncbi:holo-ACP synthase [Ameyamaea chiangmaiensis NBRC 103196]|uniref:Holo-[acyl-carrier-protein] synthase n=1 Tax=Ameyamaea chiangmaiensis TaxID=442969 RepID=A0A850P918_9PROT|nr:holo-ACP synthase [Ameyamaea chiangmaiensis]MBS4074410.1 holo-ACP synthase [Ameyamaea chiangmaiensis]NVN40484.1 holo-ACP synthase [Ameyamaea chiangmaiensis]GBQ71928.1 holo-ACP synthase [Ameyamaea chiangmaiensis NBRC 103196]